MSLSSDFYERLGIGSDASEEEIRKAFRTAAQRLHPDVNVEVGATESFLSIKEAYDVLINPARRSAYDGKAKEVSRPPVQSNIYFSRDSVTWLAEDQLIYALIEMEVLADELKSEMDETQPINIALVLDCSTSMSGKRLDIVKASSIELIRQLRSEDILSIVSFNDRAEIIMPASFHSDARKSESRIRMLQARGGTEIFQGLSAGISEVRRNLSPYYSNHVILITDGHTYGDESACVELAKNAVEQNIGISCMGIGTEWNDIFLDDISSITGGNCLFIREPKDIRTFLNQKFEDLSQVYVEGVTLNLRAGTGVNLKFAYRLKPEASALPITSSIRLGNIPKKASLSVLLEFIISPISQSIENVLLAEGSFTFRIPKHGKSQYRIPLSLHRPASAHSQSTPPPQIIIEAMSRLTLFRMQEQAHYELEAGEYKNAVARLQNLATHLFALGEYELAKTVLAETQNIQDGRGISKSGQKRIKYGTQALLLPDSLKET